MVKWGSPKSSPTTRRPPGLSTRADLAQGGDRVGDLAEDRGEDHGVDRVVLVGERGGVALGRDDVGEAALGGAADRVVEELLLQVEDLDPALGADPLGHVEGVVAGAGADLEHPLARLGRSTERSRSRVMIGCGASTQKRWP